MKLTLTVYPDPQLIFELIVLYQYQCEGTPKKKDFVEYMKEQLTASGENFAGVGENGFDPYSPIGVGNAKLLFMKWFKELDHKELDVLEG